MSIEWLDALPLWLFPFMAGAILLIALEIGYRLGGWRHARHSDEKDQPVGAMVGSVLGLLALVLGFTFSLAASRFEARRQVVLEEANAIGTTYLRAKLLHEPQRTEASNALREYVDVRVVDGHIISINEAIARSEALHERLWAQAVAAARDSPSPIMTGLFIQSLNEMIDLHAKRMLTGMRSRIPAIIWFSLCGLAVLGMIAVGYQSGLSATRRSPAMIGLVGAFVTVLFLIADLDRGHEGLFKVSQQALIDVQRSMNTPAAESSP